MKYGGSMLRRNGSGDHQVPSAATKSCPDKRHYLDLQQIYAGDSPKG
jgi:hypothetical protein